MSILRPQKKKKKMESFVCTSLPILLVFFEQRKRRILLIFDRMSTKIERGNNNKMASRGKTSQLGWHPTLDNHMATEDPTNGYKVTDRRPHKRIQGCPQKR